MLRLMRNFCFSFLLALPLFAQELINSQQSAALLNDLTWYSKQYIEPASESIIYQAASAWMISPKKREAWKFTLGLQNNLFMVPGKNRNFSVQNSDFEFFEIEGVNNNNPVTVPTVLGIKSPYYLVGNIEVNGDPQTISLRMDGVNQEIIYYPYLHGNLSLPLGFELHVKYSFKNRLKRGEYQVYGIGLQYNISQHFANNYGFNLAVLGAYNNEIINVDFVQSYRTQIDIGLRTFNTEAQGYQLQLAGSKEFGKWELIGGLVWNKSFLKHYFDGVPAEIQGVSIDLMPIFNSKVEEFKKEQTLWMGEMSARYSFAKKWHAQTTFSFGRLFNSNLGIQYDFM